MIGQRFIVANTGGLMQPLPVTQPAPVMGPSPEGNEWVGVLTVEGRATGDARMFAAGALTWADLPLPLLWQRTTADGHDNAVIVGNITGIARHGDMILGRGLFDMGSRDGVEAYRMVREQFLRGISVDADNVAPSDVEYQYGAGVDDSGGPVVSMTVIHGARIRGATLCAIPAFTEAKVSILDTTLGAPEGPNWYDQGTAPGTVRDSPGTVPIGYTVESLAQDTPEVTGYAYAPSDDVLVAAAYTLTIPDVPPAAWFDEPAAGEVKGALTVTDAGRVYGYLAPANVAHRSFAQKVTVPMGNVDYSLYMGRETIVEGGRVVTGALTMDCGHASVATLNPAVALEHYDNACSVVARVRIGENRHGVWVAGAIVPGISANQLARMMACTLSGDWRPHRKRQGWREFAAALLVPVPGFAMTRTAPSVRLDEGQLVASSVPVEFEGSPPMVCPKSSATMEISAEDLETDLTDCGCLGGMEGDDLDFINVLAASLGLDPEARIATMWTDVNERAPSWDATVETNAAPTR